MDYITKPDEKQKITLSDFFSQIYETDQDGLPKFKMFIEGKWVFSKDGSTFDVDSPIDNSIIARASRATLEDSKNAVRAAYENKQKIREIPAIERLLIFEKARELLLKHKDEVVNVLVTELGKTLKGAEGEVNATAERLKLAMEEARKIYGEYIPGDWVEDTVGKFSLVVREPIGVVLTITPFNYPLFIASAKIIPALVSGNAVVAKPSSDTPITLLLFARILEAAGIPSGTLNVVTGGGKEVGDALVASNEISMISFTGSTDVGNRIANIAGIKKLHLELGGKTAAIVLGDADLDLAARKCVEGALKNSGQRCDGISRILVHEKVADAFVRKTLGEVEKWTIGDPRDPNTKVGPLTNEAALKKVDRLVQDAIHKGAKLLKGGTYNKFYYSPTILDFVPLTADIAWEETFGPVVTIIRVKDLDEAIQVANKSKYGLDSAVFTNSFYNAWKAAKLLQDGEITINDAPAHGVGNFPFGGVKESGIGREGLGYSIDEMTTIKTIVFNLEPAGLGKAKKH